MAATALQLDARSYRGDVYQGPHQDGGLQISLVIRGAVAESVGRATEYAGALSMVVKDPGVVHADRFGPDGADILRLSARQTFADLLDDPRRSTPWTWVHEPRIAAPLLRLAARMTGARFEVAADDPDVVDVVALLTARPARPTCPPEWLVRTMESMRAEWHPALTVADVARKAGVHPVYLARCVRRWYGVGVGEELRRIRLSATAETLAAGHETVARVAHTHAFADEPHLCREFSRSTGMTPGRFRRLVNQLDFRPAGV
jgi:AraC family transcriptional regulator